MHDACDGDDAMMVPEENGVTHLDEPRPDYQFGPWTWRWA